MRKKKTLDPNRPRVVDMIEPKGTDKPSGPVPCAFVNPLQEALLRAAYMELTSVVNDFLRIEENYMRQFEAKPEIAVFRQKIKALDDQFNALAEKYMEEAGVSPQTHAYNTNERRFDPRSESSN